MKCKDCEYVEKGFFKGHPESYVCIGERHPFVVDGRLEGCSHWKKRIENRERDKILDDVWKFCVEEYDNDASPNVSDYMEYQLSLREINNILERLRKEQYKEV